VASRREPRGGPTAEVRAERAPRAVGTRPAVLHRHPDEEGVVLVEERRVVGEVRHEQGLEGRGVGGGRDDPVTREHPAGVGVDDEDRSARGVEQDGVGGLGPDPGDAQELGPESPHRLAEHPTQVAAVTGGQVIHEGAEAPRPGRSEPPGGQAAHGAWRQASRGTQAGDHRLDGRPRRVLGEEGARHHLERRPRRPPPLRPIAMMERLVEPEEPAPDGTRAPQGEPRHGPGIIR